MIYLFWKNVNVEILNITFLWVGTELTTCRIYSHTLAPLRHNWGQIRNCTFNFIIIIIFQNNAEGSLYIDDGETYDYNSNKYIYAKMSYEPNALKYT